MNTCNDSGPGHPVTTPGSWVLMTFSMFPDPDPFFFKGNFKFPFLGGLFLGPYMRHMEVPRLGVEMELQLPAYTTVTETRDPSCVCNLHCSLWQCWILNLLSSARDQTCVLIDTSLGSLPLNHNRNFLISFIFYLLI